MALTWVERNGCYVDVKFRRIKGADPDVRCVALVEVMQADLTVVREYVSAVVEHADVLVLLDGGVGGGGEGASEREGA